MMKAGSNVHAIPYGMAWACFRCLHGYSSTSRWNGRMSHAFLRVSTAESKQLITRKIENMRKIILYITASIDQRIAEPEGSLEWLIGFSNPKKADGSYKMLLASVDTVLIGGRAYRELLNMDVIWPYPEQMTYVVSHHNWGEKDNIRFITENILEAITTLRNRPGKDILLVGGGELISMLLAADLIDEMHICYLPIILGDGIPLFPEQPKESKWVLSDCTPFNSGILNVKYRRDRATPPFRLIHKRHFV